MNKLDDDELEKLQEYVDGLNDMQECVHEFIGDAIKDGVNPYVIAAALNYNLVRVFKLLHHDKEYAHELLDTTWEIEAGRVTEIKTEVEFKKKLRAFGIPMVEDITGKETLH